ncbi:YcnI family protein [Streptomyces profundus]|uniref:YcnI family copper-binding membrane protein n=1 Tax=Streptomyces profundus TaxID=2867410 RepID=UPI001D167E76|nr:YcnI family protein [Streptomyces sp. MA3_2.13]UED85236.1 YcnI family protein [Streptomyces sp. MA3_2.13]
MNHIRSGARAAVLLAGTAGLFALALPAQAHVGIDPSEVEQGGYTVVNVKVPNERDNASTVEVELHLDPDYPLTSVMPQPVPGWDVEVETTELDEPLESHGNQITEVPSVITWSGGEIAPGTFQQFPLSIGRLPDTTDQLVLKAIQTYDNDEVVRWIDEPTDDGSEPESPAAVLRLTPAAGDGHGAGDTAEGEQAATETDDAPGERAAADDDGGKADTTARVLAGVGIAVGVAGVAFGVLAGRRRATD